MAQLVTPSVDRRAAFLRMAHEWRAHGDDRYALAIDDFDGYLARIRRNEDPANVPADRVPGTQYWLEHDGEIVACVRMRFALNPSLEIEGGHIGYDVRPSARGRGFATTALRLALPEARARGLDRVLLTADADNIASIAVIVRNGGVRVDGRSGDPIVRYWIDLAHDGAR
jgi:predicted acetyltransferase